MKLSVNKEKCVGCGNCAALCPSVFEISDGKSRVKKHNAELDKNEIDCVREAEKACPVQAIEEE